MQTTNNLGLKKPEGTDSVNIDDLNGNADILDGKFGASGHTHDGTAGNGPKIGSGGLASGAGTDPIIGNRTISDSAVPTGNAGALTTLLGWLAYMVKAITGKSSWRTAPSKTLEDLNTHIGAGGSAHADATTTADGFMTAADKVKLDGIAAAANKYTHPNHTGDVTSTGDGVTAIAPGVIVDADVNSAAAIGWGKVNKSGASLADLPTRSAADLTSGTLPAARMPGLTGDITMTAGSTTTAIAPGAIVNADINASAAIDAAKIGTGTVSNTEFGYLDGVTAAVQGQLNAKLASSAYTAADVLAKLKTVDGAGSSLDADLLDGYQASDFVKVEGDTTYIELGSRSAIGPAYIDFHTSGTSSDYDSRLIAEGKKSNGTAVLTLSTDTLLFDASLSKFRDKVWVRPAESFGNSTNMHLAIGDSDTGFFWNGDGHYDMYSNNIKVATVSDGWLRLRAEDGNYYHSGNFWGEHSAESRAFGSLNHNPSAQIINASMWTKLVLTGLVEDQRGICNASNGRFVIPQTGKYLTVARIGFSLNGSNLTGLRVGLFLNGGFNAQLAELSGVNIGGGVILNGSALNHFNAGDVVEIYGYPDQSTSISQSDVYTHVSVIRIA